MKAWIGVLVLGLLLLSGCVQTGKVVAPLQDSFQNSAINSSNPSIPGNPSNASAVSSEEIPISNPIVVFETNQGTFKAELFKDKAPLTAQNFLDLTEKGFYNGLKFHRVIADFMLQGGDPIGNGTGGPGYKIKDEFGAGLKHATPGMLSMANSGPNTGGSQFFVTLVPTPWLDGKHAIFGKVVSGMDIVEKIGKLPTTANDAPLSPVIMTKVFVEK